MGRKPRIAAVDAFVVRLPGAQPYLGALPEGATLRIAVDAHWAYGIADAQRLGRGLAERGAWFLEAPLAPEDVEGHRDLARSVAIPVAVGETFRNRFEAELWLRRRALRLCQIDVARTGLTEALAIAALCSAGHVPRAPHHSSALGVALAAGVHLSAAVEQLEAFEFQPLTHPVAMEALRTPIGGGPIAFDVPAGPGLGVEPEPSILEAAVVA